MILPPFEEFYNGLNQQELNYDIKRYSTPDMSEPYNPFSKEQYDLLVKTVFSFTCAFLFEYHNWLNKLLDDE